MVILRQLKRIVLAASPVWVMTVLFQYSGQAFGATGYETGPRPDWVNPVTFEVPEAYPETDINFGILFLLVDKQARRGARYEHYAQKIMNKKGLENISRISIDFDPSYETLMIHNVDVLRKGVMYNKLDKNRIRLFQQEKELEYHIYNGEMTFDLVLDDLRVGDIVEYSFTISGENPLLRDMYYQSFGLQWGVPVYRIYYRLLWPSDRQIEVLGHGTDIKPEVRQGEGLKEYLIMGKNVKALIVDDEIPVWYSPYPWLEFSEASSWEDVAHWAMPLYWVPSKLSVELESKISEIMAASSSAKDRALSALNFVQDEIRYLGNEMGVSSYKPGDPSIVSDRRFGDCKDMSFLLHTMLRKMGIMSSPALVSTNDRGKVGERLPSPGAFDHVIVRLNIDGKTYWLDPTRSYQKGSLDHMDQPLFGAALVISDDTKGLSPISTQVKGPLQEVKEVFFIQKNNDEPSRFTIETIFRGWRADQIREDLATRSDQEIEKNYLDFYSTDYPGIKVNESFSFSDDPVKNVIVIKESYLIPNFWVNDEDTGWREGYFNPSELSQYISLPDTKQRTMPLRVPYPIHYRQFTEVNLPEDWYVDPLDIHIKDEAVDFKHKVEYKDRKLTLLYEFQSKMDHVDVADAQEHIAVRGKINDQLGYMIYYENEQYSALSDGIHRTVLFIAGLSLVVFVVLAYKVYLYDPKPGMIHSEGDPGPSGFGGWLVLLVIGVCVQPLGLVSEIILGIDVFSSSSWNSLTTPGSEEYHVLFQPLLISEIIFNVYLEVFSVLMIVLLFKRRSSFPRVYIIYIITAISITVIDTILSGAIPTLVNDNAVSMPEIVRRTTFAIVWALYLTRSERVKNTFVRTTTSSGASSI
jgi:hypothetical protein